MHAFWTPDSSIIHQLLCIKVGWSLSFRHYDTTRQNYKNRHYEITYDDNLCSQEITFLHDHL